MKNMDWPWRRTKSISSDAEAGIVCKRSGPECLVSLSGRITIGSSPDVLTLLLTRLRSPDCCSLTLDFHDVAYIDTSGLAILVETLKAARSYGKAFHLSGLRGRPRFLFETTQLLHFFEETKSEMQPLNSDTQDSG